MSIGAYKAFFENVNEIAGWCGTFKLAGGWAHIDFDTLDVWDGTYDVVRKECDDCGVRWSVEDDGRSPPEIVVFIPEQFRDELISTGVLQ